ncbi:MAG: J domain-containing protein, partial [Planctomycetota bacterium]
PGEEAPGSPMALERALEVLGIGAAATSEAIERAYRERSRTCHPDKVAHLDVDFQVLAERKFRELKEAYDLLMG